MLDTAVQKVGQAIAKQVDPSTAQHWAEVQKYLKESSSRIEKMLPNSPEFLAQIGENVDDSIIYVGCKDTVTARCLPVTESEGDIKSYTIMTASQIQDEMQTDTSFDPFSQTAGCPIDIECKKEKRFMERKAWGVCKGMHQLTDLIKAGSCNAEPTKTESQILREALNLSHARGENWLFLNGNPDNNPNNVEGLDYQIQNSGEAVVYSTPQALSLIDILDMITTLKSKCAPVAKIASTTGMILWISQLLYDFGGANCCGYQDKSGIKTFTWAGCTIELVADDQIIATEVPAGSGQVSAPIYFLSPMLGGKPILSRDYLRGARNLIPAKAVIDATGNCLQTKECIYSYGGLMNKVPEFQGGIFGTFYKANQQLGATQAGLTGSVL